MDSQTLGTLAAAVITATAGLAGVAMTRRRTSNRDKDRQIIRDEIELLAMLPADHPMHDQLSEVLEDRIRGYTRTFKDAIERPYSRLSPLAAALAGVLISAYVLQSGGGEAVWQLLGDISSGDKVSALEWQAAISWLIAFSMGMALYIAGLARSQSRNQARRWARAARGDSLPNLPTRAEAIGVVRRLWSQIATISGAWSRLRRDGRPDPANGVSRPSEPDA